MVFNLTSTYERRIIYDGAVYIRGMKYVPYVKLSSIKYDGRLDGHTGVFKFLKDANNELDPELIELLDLDHVYKKRVNKETIFSFEQFDKEDGQPLWGWWIRDYSYGHDNQ